MESALTLRERVALIQKELDLCLHLIDRLDKNPDDKDVKHRLAVEGAQVATFALGFRNECEAQAPSEPHDDYAQAKREAHAHFIQAEARGPETLDEALDNLKRLREDTGTE